MFGDAIYLYYVFNSGFERVSKEKIACFAKFALQALGSVVCEKLSDSCTEMVSMVLH